MKRTGEISSGQRIAGVATGKILSLLLIAVAAVSLTTGCLGGGGKAETEPPEIASCYPAEDAADIPVSAAVTVTFDESVKGIDGSSGILSLRRLSSVINVPADVTYDDSSYTATLTPRENLEADSYYVVTLGATVRDQLGNYIKNAPRTWVFITGELDDTEVPRIIQRSPYPGEQNIATGKALTIKFSELVTHVSGSTVTLKETSTGTIVPGTVSYDEQVATFTPDAALSQGIQYTVSCVGGTSGIRDTSGNPLVSEEWAFKVEDTTPPEILTISPEEDATSVPPNTEVQVTFSESITNVTNSTVYIEEVSTGVTYPGRVEYDSSSGMVTLKPSGDLQYDTLYRVTVEGGSGDSIMDTSYNVLSTDRIWTFTTSNAPDEVSPIVETVFPVVGAGNVSPSVTIRMTFNEDVSAVSTSTVTLKKNSDNSEVSTVVTYISGTRQAVVDPVSDLEEGESYTVSCSDSIKDTAGNPLVPESWPFTIADNTSPSITSQSPVVDAPAVKINGRVIVEFSENVTGVSGDSFYLQDASSAPVDAAVTYDSDNFRAILTPTDTLEDFATYTVYLTGAITDTSANANALTATNWSFTTENTEDTTAPEISSSSPDYQVTATDVALDCQVSITFDESVTDVSNTTVKLKQGADIVTGLVQYNAASKTAVFSPDTDLKGSTEYTVEVTTGIHDLAGNPFGGETWTFITEEDTVPPSIEERSPTAGESDVPIDTAVIIQFNENVNNVNTATFTVKDDQGTVFPSEDVTVIYDETSKTATWSLKNSVLKRGTGKKYTVTLSSAIIDDAGLPLAEIPWEFYTEPDTTPPAVMNDSESPRDGSTAIGISSSISVAFSEEIDLSTLNTNTFYIEDTATSTKKTDVTYDFNTTSKKAIIGLSTPLEAETEYRVHVIYGASGVKDLGQNSIPIAGPETEYTWTFITGQVPDETPPTVNTLVPADGTGDVALNLASITATFSEEVQNISSSTFQLKVNGVAVQADVSYNSAMLTATLSPAYNLIEGTTYTVELKNSIIDMAGNPLSEIPSWSFTTGAADDVPPVVSLYSPTGGGAPVRPTVTAVFSESVTGVSSSTFVLSQGGSTVDEVDVYYDDSTKTATLIPRNNLTPGALYTVTLTTGIADLAGNNLSSTSWTFTPTSPPEISSTTPGDGDTVAVDATSITMNFNRAMDQAAGTAVLSGGPGHLGAPTWTDSDTIVYPVIGPLGAGTDYTVTFESWWQPFKDTDGNELNTTPVVGGTLNFTTGSDGSAPSIAATVPFDGNTGVGRDIPVISITFDEPMTPSGSLSGISAGSGIWSNENRTVVFPVSSQLNASMAYTVTLNGFSDAAGNALSGTTFGFTTSAAAGYDEVIADSFESYTEPDFTYFEVITGDGGAWTQVIKANNPVATPTDGSYMAMAPTLAWGAGQKGYLVSNSLDFSIAGTYLLSFDMAHEITSPAGDYLQVSVSTNGGSSYSNLSPAVFRHDYRLYYTETVVSGDSLDDFDPQSYDSGTGQVVLPRNPTDVSNVTAGDYFNDAAGNSFIITGGVAEDQWDWDDWTYYDVFNILAGQTVDLGSGASITRRSYSNFLSYYFDLSTYVGEPSVLIRFEAVSAGDTGGNIVIDDVRIRRY